MFWSLSRDWWMQVCWHRGWWGQWGVREVTPVIDLGQVNHKSGYTHTPHLHVACPVWLFDTLVISSLWITPQNSLHGRWNKQGNNFEALGQVTDRGSPCQSTFGILWLFFACECEGIAMENNLHTVLQWTSSDCLQVTTWKPAPHPALKKHSND